MFQQSQNRMPVDIKLNVYEVKFSMVKSVWFIQPLKKHVPGVELHWNNNNGKVRRACLRMNINFGVIDRIVVPDQAIIKQAGSGTRYVYP